ncbi:MAG: addiction module protein [Stagnimonas sp.]|nr:addiction module protein [Stagnimonas sp.]
MNTQLLSQARQLSVEDQLELVEALWDGIAKRNAVPGPTDVQKAELDRRLADHEANPDDVVSWNEVKASALAQLKR